MKIVNQSAQIIIPDDPMKHIERIGRICYKSEDRIGDDTHIKFVHNLFKANHHAMLEHYRFIMEVNPMVCTYLSQVPHPYIEMTCSEFNGKYRNVISFNARALHNLVEDARIESDEYMSDIIGSIRDELIALIIKEYDCYELFGYDRKCKPLLSFSATFIPNNKQSMNEMEWKTHGWFSAHMITDRGVSHEIVRHRRQTSFAQESTRYCNYNKLGEITVIDQGFKLNYNHNHSDMSDYICWYNTCVTSEMYYNSLIKNGIKPEMARSVLPTCLKTEIVMTAPIYEWDHFFNLRLHGTTGKPHYLIRDLAKMIFTQMEEIFYGDKNKSSCY